ncbi:gliding motility-associated C-terminal domain-containing protein [Fulvivirga sp. M361]|uniref:T9SS type B sorting domain-containing protein n=1 Tax=Fulvivirga sp. M361 TaxID=2594266 RepID=UPI00117AA8B1|nr:gliding motility-associated C-terminal domain-containing protein [Fulvivirga sp. M361]TRX51303.1 gliding motility-associated C-terminal domain-containing protein [Fulvivirga sp. M361]
MTRSKVIRFSFFILFGFLSLQQAQATHLRAGEIVVRRLGGLEVEVTIIVFTDSEPGITALFGDGQLSFGEVGDRDEFRLPSQLANGFAYTATPEGTILSQEPIDVSNLGENVSQITYTVKWLYGSVGNYLITYTEANRNDDIQNIPDDIPFHIETEVVFDNSIGINNSPVFLIPPIDRACSGVAFFHNAGAFSPDVAAGHRDSLAYELVVPKMSLNANAAGHIEVINPGFYSNFNQGNEDRNGPPDITIDPITGEIKWDSPGFVGEYTIAFVVKKYRFVTVGTFSEWVPTGFVRRDMQIEVEDCDNERPEVQAPEDICVVAGTTLNELITSSDPDGDDVMIEAASELFENGSGASVDRDGLRQPNPGFMNFLWTTECLDVRRAPYSVIFKTSDFPDNGPSLVSFDDWNITVIGPEPEWNSIQPMGQGLQLQWDSYECQSADAIQIWRRVDSNPYTPDECEIGIREDAGYELLTTVPQSATSYEDNDLIPGAKLCYRLVATFSDESGEFPGQVSDEICFEFVPAETPVITHVSVQRTDDTDGEMVVAWHAPLDSGTLTPPFTYRIERADGFSGDVNLVTVGEIEVPDSDPTIDSIGFVDTGLNTLDNVYNYRVTLIDPGSTTDDLVSEVASSVRLEATPEIGQIRLTWSADVPWSNVVINPPNIFHEIFRRRENEPESQMQRIATIDTSQSGFEYLDNNNLEPDQVYCYRVLTKGTYGNPEIQTGLRPLLNFSQVTCSQPADDTPPCAPILTVDGPDCDDFLARNTCSFNDFSNELTWTTDFSGDACQNDIRYYVIYYAQTTESEFRAIDSVATESFIHEDLPSFKGCYKIQAVDRSGNRGEFSNTICVDNCPYYELPNVFTPNGDQCNELFQAYNDIGTLGADGQFTGDCGRIEVEKCARFVLGVEFQVFNRWGRPVFSYSARSRTEPAIAGLSPILINWDGRGDNGNLLASGTYYYLAKVTFDTVDPQNAVQDIKGWVQLIR